MTDTISRFVTNLEGRLKEQGLLEMKKETYTVGLEIVRSFTDVALIGIEDLALRMRDQEKQKKLLDLVRSAAEQVEQGAGSRNELVVFIGRKPPQ